MLLREHERALFTDRSEILAALHRNAELIRLVSLDVERARM